MNKLNYILVSTLIIASLIYASMLLYYHDRAQDKTKFIDFIRSPVSEETSSDLTYKEMLDNLGSKELSLEPVGLSISENRAIVFVMLLAASMFCLVIFFSLRQRIKYGSNAIQVPIITLALLLTITFVSQSYWFGVF